MANCITLKDIMILLNTKEFYNVNFSFSCLFCYLM